jgi:hypothetical protein
MTERPDLKVVPIPRPTRESEILVNALDACFTQAEKGDVTAFVLVTLKRDGSVMRANARADDADVFKLLGVLTHESRNLTRLIDATNEITDHLKD